MRTTVAENKDYRGKVHQLSRDIMTDWMTELKEATESPTPSAYLMISGNCVEILRCFDILPAFPEVNALQLAIRASTSTTTVASDLSDTSDGGRSPKPAAAHRLSA